MVTVMVQLLQSDVVILPNHRQYLKGNFAASGQCLGRRQLSLNDAYNCQYYMTLPSITSYFRPFFRWRLSYDSRQKKTLKSWNSYPILSCYVKLPFRFVFWETLYSRWGSLQTTLPLFPIHSTVFLSSWTFLDYPFESNVSLRWYSSRVHFRLKTTTS